MWMWCRAAGLEPATTRLRGEGTPACASGRLGCGASSCGCEARIRTRISWFRARRGAGCTTSHRSGWRDSNSQPPAPRAGALPLRHIQLAGTDGRIRTDTGGGLSAVPLPVGLRQRVPVDRAGVEPAPSSLQGSHASSCAIGPGFRVVVAGAGIEPARRAYETPLIARSPASRGDRPDSNRLLPGPRPGVSSTSTSATVDEGGLEPPASSL